MFAQDGFEAAKEELEEAFDLERGGLFLVEAVGIGEDEEEIGEIGDDGEEEEDAAVLELENEEDGEQGGEGGAEQGEGAGATVYETFLLKPVFFFKVLIDNGFVCAGAKGFSEAKEEHGEGEKPEIAAEKEEDEGDDIENETEIELGFFAVVIGEDTGGNFEEVVDDFANGIEQADLEEIELGIEEDENEEGFEEF